MFAADSVFVVGLCNYSGDCLIEHSGPFFIQMLSFQVTMSFSLQVRVEINQEVEARKGLWLVNFTDRRGT